jgi:hypothetical protein
MVLWTNQIWRAELRVPIVWKLDLSALLEGARKWHNHSKLSKISFCEL